MTKKLAMTKAEQRLIEEKLFMHSLIRDYEHMGDLEDDGPAINKRLCESILKRLNKEHEALKRMQRMQAKMRRASNELARLGRERVAKAIHLDMDNDHLFLLGDIKKGA